jgi:hypothetical protein
MKKPILFILLLANFSIWAQTNTEIFLTEIQTIEGKIELTNLKNISNNEGYDNQPSFFDDNSILFSSARNGQTDIAKYDITSGEISWLTDTPSGGEYSPLRIPDSDNISAIRLDASGLQRLYRYDTATGKSKFVRQDAKVGYHVWHSKGILVNTLLVDNRMDLVVSNLKDDTNYTVQQDVGRSLHKIPNSDLVSYIAKDKDEWSIKSLNPITGTTKVISSLPKGAEDICWLPNGTILVPTGNLVYIVNPESNKNQEVINLSDHKEISSISRMAVSADGKYLALVSEEPPSKIVQKQVDSYNAANLDAFVNCYAENVVVSYFPADIWYEGHKRMREIYAGLSPERKTYEVEVLKRITIGNKVIDHEKVAGGGRIQMQVAIYEVGNGAIDSMTFIFDESAPDPETIVQKQLDAYNARDIDAFLETYTNDVELYNFPTEKRSQGQIEMRKGYAAYFESTPDLNCEIKNRIIIRNIVIDEEYITANGKNFSAVAVYEVENGKIAKVTFLR